MKIYKIPTSKLDRNSNKFNGSLLNAISNGRCDVCLIHYAYIVVKTDRCSFRFECDVFINFDLIVNIILICVINIERSRVLGRIETISNRSIPMREYKFDV